jgi:hypothetical protein
MASQQDLLANLQALTQQAQGGIPRMVQPTSRTNGPQFSAAPKLGGGLTDKYASVNTNPNEVKANQAKIKLNNAANVASARYPGLTDKFGGIAAGEKQDTGVLGAVFNNPITKTFLKGIEVIDAPRRAVISGVREIADVLDSDKNTSFSVTDWFNQTKDPMYGFGKAFPMKGWGGRIIGLIGDIALDPMTYASLGTYIPAEVAAEGARGGLRAAMQGVKHLNTAEGRLALANLARKKGASAVLQKEIASEGRLALKGSAEMAQAMGMRKSGVYLFDSRFFPKAMSTRLPGSGQVADFIERRLVNRRLGFWNTGFGTKVGKKLTRAGVDEADTSAIRFAIAAGQLPAEQVPHILNTLSGKNAQRIAAAVAKDVAVKTIVPLIEDADVALTKETLYKFLDTPEELWAGLGRTASVDETKAYTKVREVMKTMSNTVRDRLSKLGLDIGEFDSYFPHMASEQTLKLMDDTTNDYLRNAVRSYLTVNIADTAKAFGHRSMRSGDDFFGHILTGEDIMAGVERFNEIAKRATHPGGKINPHPIAFNFFETDVAKVLSQYANQYAGTHGAIGFMEDMIQNGSYKLGDEVVEFDMEAAKEADELVKSKARAYSSAVNDSITAGKNVTKEINDSLVNVTRAKATTVAPRGAVQLEVDAARTALNEVLPVDVATQRLTAAQTALTTQMKKLNDSWMDLSNEFNEQSNVLLLMNQSHKDLIASHQNVLDELNYFIANKEKVAPKIPGLKSEKAKLEAALKKLSKQIDSHNNAMDAAINMGPEINQMIDGTYRALDDLTGEVLDAKIFVGNESLQDIVNFFQKNPFAGQTAGVTKPLGKAEVGRLVKSEQAIKFLDAIDPLIKSGKTGKRTGRITAARLGKMTMDDVVNIISSGHTSAANLDDLRHAGAWLFIRDMALNGGQIPEHAAAQFDNMQTLLELAFNAQKLVRSGRGTAETIIEGARIQGNNFNSAFSNLKFATEEHDLIVERLNSIGGTIDSYLENDGFVPDFVTKKEEELASKWQQAIIARDKAQKDYDKFFEGGTTSQKDAAKILSAPDGYRRLASDVANSLAEYRISSTVSKQFKLIADKAKLLGRVPTEQMYNKLVAGVVAPHIESSAAFVARIDIVQETMKKVAEVVRANPTDKNNALKIELLDLFSNPKRVEEANAVRAVVPEMEVAVLKGTKKSETRIGRLFVDSPEFGDVTKKLKDLREEFGIAPRQDISYGKKPTRQAKTFRMTGTDEADAVRLDITEFENITGEIGAGGRVVSSTGKENASDVAYKQMNEDVKLIEKAIKKKHNPTGDKQFFDTQEFRDDMARLDEPLEQIARITESIKLKRKVSESKLKEFTGRGAQASSAIIGEMKSLGETYGLYSTIERALGTSPSSVDNFLADFLGGNKFDPRLGYTSSKRSGRKGMGLISKPNARDSYVMQSLNDAGELVSTKTSRPSIFIPEDKSWIGQLRTEANDRLFTYKVLANDSDFIPGAELRSGQAGQWVEEIQQTIDPVTGKQVATVTGKKYKPGKWVFGTQLHGPEGYSLALKQYVDELDEKIVVAARAQKEIDKLNKQKGRIVSKAETDAQVKRLQMEKSASNAARQRLEGLKQQPIHAAAVEKDELNQFLKVFARLNGDEAAQIDWGINASRAGFGATDEEWAKQTEQLYGGRVAQFRDLLNKKQQLTRELNVIERQPGKKATFRSVKLRSQLEKLEKYDIPRLQKSLGFAAYLPDSMRLSDRLLQSGYIPEQIAQTGFRLTKEEWDSLWLKPLTSKEVSNLIEMQNVVRNDIKRIQAQQEVLWNNWEDVTSRQQFFMNEERMNQLSNDFEELVNQHEVHGVRYNAVLKMQAIKNELGGADGFDVAVSKAKKLIKGKGTITDYAATGRRKFLQDALDGSEEGAHIIRVRAEEAASTKPLLEAKNRNLQDLQNLRDKASDQILSLEKGIEDLQIGKTIEAMDRIISGATDKLGVALESIGKDVPAKEVSQSAGRNVKALQNFQKTQKGKPYLKIDKAAMDEAIATNNVEVQKLITEQREVTKQLLKFDRKLMSNQNSVAEAEAAIRNLFEMSDKQLKEIGLPTKREFKQRIDLLKQLADRQAAVEDFVPSNITKQERIVEKLGERTSTAQTKASLRYKRLSDSLAFAQTKFDQSVSLREPLETTYSEAQKKLAYAKELRVRASKLSGVGKSQAKTPAWQAEVDSLIADFGAFAPLIEGTNIDKRLKKVMSDFLNSKAALNQTNLELTVAEQEQNLMRGLKAMAGPDNVLGKPGDVKRFLSEAGIESVGRIKIKTVFDDGFVALSEKYPNIGVAKEIAEIVQNVHRVQDPAIAQALSKFLSGYTQFFKAYATLSPGFHVRNGLSNGFMLFAAGGSPDTLAQGLKWSREWREASKSGKTFVDWIETVPVKSRETVRQAYYGMVGSGSGMTADALERGMLPGTKHSRKLGEFIEAHSRFMLSYDGAAKGFGTDENLARVRRFLIDYQDVSSLDKTMKQIIPFWMWTSRNFPMQLMNMYSNPRAYQIYGALKRNLTGNEQDGTLVPSWITEMGAFKLPFGNNLYATPDVGFNRIGQQLNEFSDPARMLSNVNPLLRLPMELAGNRQYYNNRQFSDKPVEVTGGLSSIYQPILQGLGLGDTGPTGKKFVDDKAYYALRNLIPFLNTAERLSPSTPTYSGRGSTNSLLGFLGIPVKQITPEMQSGEAYSRLSSLQKLVTKQKAMEGK